MPLFLRVLAAPQEFEKHDLQRLVVCREQLHVFAELHQTVHTQTAGISSTLQQVRGSACVGVSAFLFVYMKESCGCACVGVSAFLFVYMKESCGCACVGVSVFLFVYVTEALCVPCVCTSL